MSDTQCAVPDTTRQQCPRCDATTAKAASLTDRFVYVRCKACGEVWVIPERRQFPRQDADAAR